jgi:hypothetical protein
MRKIWCIVLLVFLAMGICNAKVPNLVGNWASIEKGYAAESGSYKLFENNVNCTFSEQNDRLFKGNVSWMENGTKVVDRFAGVIAPDNKTFYSTEIAGGYALGTIISDDEIDITYLADGATGTASFQTLHRIK